MNILPVLILMPILIIYDECYAPVQTSKQQHPAKSAEDFFFLTHAPETTGAAPTLGHRSRASHNIETTSPAKRAEETRHAKRRVSMQKGSLLLRLVCSREKQSAGAPTGY